MIGDASAGQDCGGLFFGQRFQAECHIYGVAYNGEGLVISAADITAHCLTHVKPNPDAEGIAWKLRGKFPQLRRGTKA